MDSEERVICSRWRDRRDMVVCLYVCLYVCSECCLCDDGGGVVCILTAFGWLMAIGRRGVAVSDIILVLLYSKSKYSTAN